MSDASDENHTVHYESETNTYRVEYDTERDRPSLTLVFAVATIIGCEVNDLPLLQEVVSPEGLDDLFATTERGRPRCDGRVEFEYHGFHVTVYGYGLIEIRPHDRPEGDGSKGEDSDA